MRNYLKELKSKSWTRYWMAHIVISLLVSGVFLLIGSIIHQSSPLLAYTGALGYLFREITQFEYEKKFDWLGFLFPLLTCIILYWIIK